MSFSTRELALLRETARATMTSVLKLVTPTYSSDGMGGRTEGTPTLGAATVCRLEPISERERELGGRVSSKTEFRLFCPYDFSVTSAKRVQVDDVIYEISEVLSLPTPDVVEVVLGVYKVT